MSTLRCLFSNTTPLNLSRTLYSCRLVNAGVVPYDSLIRNLYSLFSREEFNSSSRTFSTASDSSFASALNLDHRVSATVITGFLGSGKVRTKKYYYYYFPWKT